MDSRRNPGEPEAQQVRTSGVREVAGQGSGSQDVPVVWRDVRQRVGGEPTLFQMQEGDATRRHVFRGRVHTLQKIGW